ncbi:unnamed protein product [Amoebophrya sp. A120]|nr:unnamed protein product [Amoebophrya sp. A120]|eukprot:GSA120T00007442001.1
MHGARLGDRSRSEDQADSLLHAALFGSSSSRARGGSKDGVAEIRQMKIFVQTVQRHLALASTGIPFHDGTAATVEKTRKQHEVDDKNLHRTVDVQHPTSCSTLPTFFHEDYFLHIVYKTGFADYRKQFLNLPNTTAETTRTGIDVPAFSTVKNKTKSFTLPLHGVEELPWFSRHFTLWECIFAMLNHTTSGEQEGDLRHQEQGMQSQSRVSVSKRIVVMEEEEDACYELDFVLPFHGRPTALSFRRHQRAGGGRTAGPLSEDATPISREKNANHEHKFGTARRCCKPRAKGGEGSTSRGVLFSATAHTEAGSFPNWYPVLRPCSGSTVAAVGTVQAIVDRWKESYSRMEQRMAFSTTSTAQQKNDPHHQDQLPVPTQKLREHQTQTTKSGGLFWTFANKNESSTTTSFNKVDQRMMIQPALLPHDSGSRFSRGTTNISNKGNIKSGLMSTTRSTTTIKQLKMTQLLLPILSPGVILLAVASLLFWPVWVVKKWCPATSSTTFGSTVAAWDSTSYNLAGLSNYAGREDEAILQQMNQKPLVSTSQADADDIASSVALEIEMDESRSFLHHSEGRWSSVRDEHKVVDPLRPDAARTTAASGSSFNADATLKLQSDKAPRKIPQPAGGGGTSKDQHDAPAATPASTSWEDNKTRRIISSTGGATRVLRPSTGRQRSGSSTVPASVLEKKVDVQETRLSGINAASGVLVGDHHDINKFVAGKKTVQNLLPLTTGGVEAPAVSGGDEITEKGDGTTEQGALSRDTEPQQKQAEEGQKAEEKVDDLQRLDEDDELQLEDPAASSTSGSSDAKNQNLISDPGTTTTTDVEAEVLFADWHIANFSYHVMCLFWRFAAIVYLVAQFCVVRSTVGCTARTRHHDQNPASTRRPDQQHDGSFLLGGLISRARVQFLIDYYIFVFGGIYLIAGFVCLPVLLGAFAKAAGGADVGAMVLCKIMCRKRKSMMNGPCTTPGNYLPHVGGEMHSPPKQALSGAQEPRRLGTTDENFPTAAPPASTHDGDTSCAPGPHLPLQTDTEADDVETLPLLGSCEQSGTSSGNLSHRERTKSETRDVEDAQRRCTGILKEGVDNSTRPAILTSASPPSVASFPSSAESNLRKTVCVWALILYFGWILAVLHVAVPTLVGFLTPFLGLAVLAGLVLSSSSSFVNGTIVDVPAETTTMSLPLLERNNNNIKATSPGELGRLHSRKINKLYNNSSSKMNPSSSSCNNYFFYWHVLAGGLFLIAFTYDTATRFFLGVAYLSTVVLIFTQTSRSVFRVLVANYRFLLSTSDSDKDGSFLSSEKSSFTVYTLFLCIDKEGKTKNLCDACQPHFMRLVVLYNFRSSFYFLRHAKQVCHRKNTFLIAYFSPASSSHYNSPGRGDEQPAQHLGPSIPHDQPQAHHTTNSAALLTVIVELFWMIAFLLQIAVVRPHVLGLYAGSVFGQTAGLFTSSPGVGGAGTVEASAYLSGGSGGATPTEQLASASATSNVVVNPSAEWFSLSMLALFFFAQAVARLVVSEAVTYQERRTTTSGDLHGVGATSVKRTELVM